MSKSRIHETLIVGGGLSGMHTASRLAERGHDFLLLEGRDHPGGRIHSVNGIDLGGSWFWPGHNRITSLLAEYGVGHVAQFTEGLAMYEAGGQTERFEAANAQTSFRIAGGASALLSELALVVDEARMQLSTTVHSISEMGTTLRVAATRASSGGASQDIVFTAKRVVLALPHRLIARIQFTPSLSPEAMRALTDTPTWMATQAKFAASYSKPFWRDAGLSGHAFSRRGPLVEIHDASPQDAQGGALIAFVGRLPGALVDNEQTLRLAALEQLARLYGPAALEPSATYLKNWASEPLTASSGDIHQVSSNHPRYGVHHATKAIAGGKILLSGTESAPRFGGYMEGAIESSEAVLKRLTQH